MRRTDGHPYSVAPGRPGQCDLSCYIASVTSSGGPAPADQFAMPSQQGLQAGEQR